MTNILENYTNAERKEFMKNALLAKKRIEKIGDKLYALNDNEAVKNGEIVVDNDRQKNIRKAQFEKEFFNTSLGWVSRKVHMQTGEVWDFLKDFAKPDLLDREIITYTPNEDYTSLEQHKGVVVTQQFLQECEEQIHKDFYGE